ncbi:24517_t:CDS:2, partial [Gigaspora margarita]
DYIEVENNAKVNEENANKNNKPRKLVKKKGYYDKDVSSTKLAEFYQNQTEEGMTTSMYCEAKINDHPIFLPESSDSKETDDEEEWETDDDEEYEEEYLINKTYLYQEIYDESNNLSNEYYLENQTNNTKK